MTRITKRRSVKYRTRFTDVELRYLLGNHKIKTVGELARELGRTPSTISNKLAALGLAATPDDSRWTRDDIQFLCDKAGVISATQIADTLNRSPAAVHAKARELKIDVTTRKKST